MKNCPEQNLSSAIKPDAELRRIWEFRLPIYALPSLTNQTLGDGMELPPEYVLHLLPLMAVCGIPPPQPPTSSPNEKRTERSSNFSKAGSPQPALRLASIPYIDQELGLAILKLIDQWRTLALWEPFASKERQALGATLEGMFRVIPVDRVSRNSKNGLIF